MTGDLEGKVAFITGAARGQGRADAVALARAGADIVAVDVVDHLPGVAYPDATPGDLAETVRMVEAEGRRIIAEKADVRDLDQLRGTADRAVDKLGRLDVVVANAGICIAATWDQTTSDMLRDVLDINVVGVWNTVMASAHHLIEGGGGSVILISSYAGKKVQPFMVPYTASKHAVTGMTRAFAAELGRHHIRVNSIHPGAVNTPMGSEEMIARLTAAGETNPVLMNMGTSFLPEYSCEPEKIAGAVVFLASDAASYITAEHISVDGGAQYF